MFPNWFEPYAKGCFEKYLVFGANPPVFLQIGAFTGDASIWLLDHFPTSCLVDVDTWAGSDEPEHADIDWGAVEKVYNERTVAYRDSGRLFKRVGASREVLRQMTGQFDFIYIDGDHTPTGVLSDAVNAFRLLKVDGLLAFDDYRWLPHGGGMGPGLAVDAFRTVFAEELELIHLGAQAWFRKTA